ncbi:MAG: CBS domain-containing protein [Pyrinomonadaceae bacterium]|nr:CBS domain-containing protein [Pyrinomonadaceae bacterium]
MNVKEIMTPNPVCCTPESSLQEAAKLMLDQECGCIPVVENTSENRPVGMITDRDITIRTIAEGRDPMGLSVGDVMTHAAFTVTPETSVEDCCNVMEQHQVRRVAVVDGNGACCGMVSQADIATNAGNKMTGEVVQEVSKTTAGSMR